MDPDVLLLLILRLPDDSAFSAHIQDAENWRTYLGWGMDRQIAVMIHDYLELLSRGTINWKKTPKPSPFPRPWVAQKKAKEIETLSDEDRLRQVLGVFGKGARI